MVWKEHYLSYGYPQGNGYFVRYKNKCEDEFSTNWFDASKYRSINGAIDRLGLSYESIKSMDDFLNANCSKSFLRNKKMSSILGSPTPSICFEKGHIDSIDDDGNIKNAIDEVIEYIENHIKKNIKKENRRIDKISKRNPDLLHNSHIDNSDYEEFWNEVLNEK